MLFSSGKNRFRMFALGVTASAGLLAGSAQAAVLVGDATVTVLLNDFWGGNLLVSQLAPPTSSTDPCRVSGNNNGTDGTWVWDYDLMTAEERRNADKVYTLLNMAWLAEMTVTVESLEELDEVCAHAEYIILHNPAYP